LNHEKRIKVYCPKCDKYYTSNGKGHSNSSARDNLISHLQRDHGMEVSEARGVLAQAGLLREGQDIKDAIKEYNKLVAEGVIVE
jgi:hypothetical protein